MQERRQYFVYIVASRSRTLYVGVTNCLSRRVREHRGGVNDGFTARYKIHRLVYFEGFRYVRNAIHREKVLKHCTRAEKLALIAERNPAWVDFAEEFGWGAGASFLGGSGSSAFGEG